MKDSNKLWVFGDSYSKGLGLIDDGNQYSEYKGKEKKIWSTLLANYLELEEENKALNGISNDMIFDIIKETFDEVKTGDKVVIGLTKIPRLGVYSPKAKLKLRFDKTPLRDSNKEEVPGLSFGKEWLSYIRDNMDQAYQHTIDTFLFAAKAYGLKGVRAIIWDNSLWDKFPSIKSEIGRHDNHWGVEGHKLFFNEIKTRFKK